MFNQFGESGRYDVNSRYEAIIALDRSIRDFRTFGWTQGDFGYMDESKCAIGALSNTLVGSGEDVGERWFVLTYPCEATIGRVAGIALFEALTLDQKGALGTECFKFDKVNNNETCSRAFKVAVTGNATHVQYSTLAIVANDHVMESETEIIRWFSDAIDVLAQELPVPAGPLFEWAEKITTAGRVVV